MPEPIPTDAELWRQAERLRALARTLIADPGLGEDVVQDAWVAALRRPAAARASLGAWLAGTVRNLARRARQREAQRTDVERRAARGEAQEGPEEAVARAELQQRLGAAVLALDEPYRSAVILRHFDQLDPGAIARRQGCTREAARQRIARGLEQLRKRLDAEHGGREPWCLLFAPLARTVASEALAPTLATALGVSVMTSKWILGPAVLSLLATLFWMSRDSGRGAPEAAAPKDANRTELRAALERAEEGARASSPAGERAVAVVGTKGLEAPPAVPERPVLSGRVIDRVGSPIGGARVSLRYRELRGFIVLDLEVARSARPLEEQRTGADGTFAFELDPGLAVDVWAEKEGFSETVTIDRHAGQTLELVLGPGFRVHGRVTRESDGRPVAGATIKAIQLGGHAWNHRRDVQTDADGRYELRMPVSENVSLDVLPLVEQARDNLIVQFDGAGEARLDVQVVEGIEVVGRVTDAATGRPIAGATIGEGWTYRRTAVSDANGVYRLTGFGETGVYELYARAKGFGQAVDSPELIDARRRRLDFALKPARAARGRLIDAAGRAVAGARVAAVAKGRSSAIDWSSAQSDADGRFTCVDLVPELRHALLVHHEDFATVTYDFPPEEMSTRELDLGEIVLAPPGLIAGRVLDAEGHGVASAALTLEGTNRDRRRLLADPALREKEVAEPYVSEREAYADEEGRFWFGQVAEGDYTLAAHDTGRAPLEGLVLTLGAGEQRTDVELVFAVGATLRGRVVDDAGLALGNVKVYAESEPPRRGTGTRLSVRSAADGTFELRDVPAGTYTLEVFPFLPGSLPSSDPLAPWLYSALEGVPTDSEPVVFVVRRGELLQGVLRNAAGEPLYGYQLTIRDQDGNHGLGGSTDSEGRFTLGVEPGTTWTVEVSGPDGEKGFHTLLVREGVPAGTCDLELRLAQ